MIDTSDRYVRTGEGEYHYSNCLIANAADELESVHELPEDASLADCCN